MKVKRKQPKKDLLSEADAARARAEAERVAAEQLADVMDDFDALKLFCSGYREEPCMPAPAAHAGADVGVGSDAGADAGVDADAGVGVGAGTGAGASVAGAAVAGKNR